MVRPQDRKFVTADPDKCIGCCVCEYACSMVNEKTFNPTKSRIRAMRMGPLVNLALPADTAKSQHAWQLAQETHLPKKKQRHNSCGRERLQRLWMVHQRMPIRRHEYASRKENRIHMQQLHRQRNKRATMRQMVPRRSINIR
jgi:ferredoxin